MYVIYTVGVGTYMSTSERRLWEKEEEEKPRKKSIRKKLPVASTYNSDTASQLRYMYVGMQVVELDILANKETSSKCTRKYISNG